MKIETVIDGLIVIRPESDGGYITQSNDLNIRSRMFSKEIYLAKNSFPEDYKEITEDEYKSLKTEQDELFTKENSKEDDEKKQDI